VRCGAASASCRQCFRRLIDLSVIHCCSSIRKESQQFLQYFFRLLFRQVVSAVQRSALNGCTRMLSPHLKHVPELAHGTFLSPKREDWALYFSPCVLVFLIHLKIDVRGCPEILATRVDCFWLTEATLVLLQCFVRQRSGSPTRRRAPSRRRLRRRTASATFPESLSSRVSSAFSVFELLPCR